MPTPNTSPSSHASRSDNYLDIVSDKLNSNGVPYIIHNIGAGVSEDDSLFTYPLTGHYRIKDS